MKFEIHWSPVALAGVNLVFACMFFINSQVSEMIPLLFRAGGKEYTASIEMLKLLLLAYPFVFGASVLLSWFFFFWNKNNTMITFCAFLPLIPALILLFVRIKFSLLQDVYDKLKQSTALKMLGLPKKLLPF